MTWSNVAKGAAVVALLSSAPMGAGAMPIVGRPDPAGRVNDDLIQTVAQVRARGGVRVHGGRNVQVNRTKAVSGTKAVNRPMPVNRSGNAHVDANRNVHVSGYPPAPPVSKPPVVVGGGWARPSWYHWAPGGAIAAGAAIGFVTAATATWATPPQPGLCWYYTDPSQRDGFWDACP